MKTLLTRKKLYREKFKLFSVVPSERFSYRADRSIFQKNLVEQTIQVLINLPEDGTDTVWWAPKPLMLITGHECHAEEATGSAGRGSWAPGEPSASPPHSGPTQHYPKGASGGGHPPTTSVRGAGALNLRPPPPHRPRELHCGKDPAEARSRPGAAAAHGPLDSPAG